MLHLTLNENQNKNVLNSYGPGYLEINKIRYFDAVTFRSNGPVKFWKIENIEKINDANLFDACDINDSNRNVYPELLIIGTGDQQILISRYKLLPIIKLGIAIEVMSTYSAISTFLIASEQDRDIAVGLFPINNKIVY